MPLVADDEMVDTIGAKSRSRSREARLLAQGVYVQRPERSIAPGSVESLNFNHSLAEPLPRRSRTCDSVGGCSTGRVPVARTRT
jgi:hypothetical protein